MPVSFSKRQGNSAETSFYRAVNRSSPQARPLGSTSLRRPTSRQETMSLGMHGSKKTRPDGGTSLRHLPQLRHAYQAGKQRYASRDTPTLTTGEARSRYGEPAGMSAGGMRPQDQRLDVSV